MLNLINRSYSKNLSSSLFSNFGVGQSTFSSFSSIFSTSTKRTFLLSRKIGPTFCVRSMRTSLRTAVFESNQLSRQLYRSSRIFQPLDRKSQIPRYYATRSEVDIFEKETGIKIRMTQSYNEKIHGHYCFQDKAKEGLDILTHWGSQNLIVCDGDIIGNPSFIEHKTRFQKFIENKCWTRALRKIEYERLCMEKTRTTLMLIKIMKADPKAGRLMQDFFAFCKNDKEMTRLEKNAFITSVVKDFIKNYKNK